MPRWITWIAVASAAAAALGACDKDSGDKRATPLAPGADAGAKASGGRLPPREAIAESVRTRIRPIFMSTLTSVGGMLPLVLMPGAGSELYRGIGSVVVGGLLVSTVFTILLVPLLMNVLLPRRFARLGESAGAS